ncbi:hypothetical protein U9M48_029011 [Paspalum notatum var. saurae]|uniref:Uncharacterized protein n=1 Tax=Paspalum notatum var. saurae TaxID=547442 RepID=A0AAQ3X0R0_PASNO
MTPLLFIPMFVNQTWDRATLSREALEPNRLLTFLKDDSNIYLKGEQLACDAAMFLAPGPAQVELLMATNARPVSSLGQ